MTIARPRGFQVIALPPAQKSETGLLRRLIGQIFVSREQEAQRAVEAYIARRGQRLTDSLEREIGECVLGGDSKFRR